MGGVGKGQWLAVDIIGTRLNGEVFVHSAAGEPVARPLNRCAAKLGLDRVGEDLVRAVVMSSIAGQELPSIAGIHAEAHHVEASDSTPVGLLVWVGTTEPTERATYNAWILDIAAKTTRTSGDDPSIIGDGREAGEERPFHQLFTWLNPEDAWSLVGKYYDALTGDNGMLLKSHWSLRPNGTEWVHMWSSARLRIADDGKRTLYGFTLRIKDREIEANIASLIRFSSATLLIVEARERWPMTSIGKLAPLGEGRINQIMSQIDLGTLSNPLDPVDAQQQLSIDGQPYLASTFKLHSTQENHGDPLAIVLLVADQ